MPQGSVLKYAPVFLLSLHERFFSLSAFRNVANGFDRAHDIAFRVMQNACGCMKDTPCPLAKSECRLHRQARNPFFLRTRIRFDLPLRIEGEID